MDYFAELYTDPKRNFKEGFRVSSRNVENKYGLGQWIYCIAFNIFLTKEYKVINCLHSSIFQVWLCSIGMQIVFSWKSLTSEDDRIQALLNPKPGLLL
jgi:hypothetical protein